ncbi:uncharacterized protein [Rutidosis leptorrhynchoides]|uniref:uncharacterized protein n=1 Tax=Rutidosis leptorrhynchoides TaxID=125765 RepID=UPI003A997D8E
MKSIPNPHAESSRDPKDQISFYITNLPERMDRKGLWSLCQSYGVIVDSYVAYKKSKLGTRFGFVRFAEVKDSITFARLLSTIKVDNVKLFATVSRFQSGKHPNKSKPFRQAHQYTHNDPKEQGNKDQSSNDGSSNYHKGRNRNDSYVLAEQDLVQISNPMESILVKLKDVHTVTSIRTVLKEEGFDDVTIQYVGGLWIWCIFDSVDACAAFKVNTTLRSLYSFARPIVINFVMDERLTWVEIFGMPLCAWKSSAFKRVSELFGRFIFFDKESCNVMSLGRVCIATRLMSFINEMVNVEINGVTYDVFDVKLDRGR